MILLDSYRNYKELFQLVIEYEQRAELFLKEAEEEEFFGNMNTSLYLYKLYQESKNESLKWLREAKKLKEMLK